MPNSAREVLQAGGGQALSGGVFCKFKDKKEVVLWEQRESGVRSR